MVLPILSGLGSKSEVCSSTPGFSGFKQRKIRVSKEIIASSARSNERQQAPGPSVNFKDETIISGDLRNESQKTQAERLKPRPEN